MRWPPRLCISNELSDKAEAPGLITRVQTRRLIDIAVTVQPDCFPSGTEPSMYEDTPIGYFTSPLCSPYFCRRSRSTCYRNVCLYFKRRQSLTDQGLNLGSASYWLRDLGWIDLRTRRDTLKVKKQKTFHASSNQKRGGELS